MKRLSLSIILTGFLFGCIGCSSSELELISQGLLLNLVRVVPFVGLIIGLIFILNRFIRSNGQTNNKLCGIIGAITFPFLFLVFLGIVFHLGFGFWVIFASILIGGLIGGLSFTLDELMISFWENKRITIPAVLGLVTGGWLFISIFTQVWMRGNMYVTHRAIAHRVVVQRWTQHTTHDKDGTHHSYSWDDYSSAEKFGWNDDIPPLIENVDYRLGYGYGHRQDRVGRHEYYRFIGGHFYSEDDKTWRSFRWLMLTNPNVKFTTGVVQDVQSDFYGHPMRNGGQVKPSMALPQVLASPPLPTIGTLPPATLFAKVFYYLSGFISRLFGEHEYRPLLYLILAIMGILVLLLIFVQSLRIPIGIYFLCSSIIILIIVLFVAARTGSLGGLSSSRRRGGGGGGFGGRGGSW